MRPVPGFVELVRVSLKSCARSAERSGPGRPAKSMGDYVAT